MPPDGCIPLRLAQPAEHPDGRRRLCGAAKPPQAAPAPGEAA